jgi:hypothetical protein
MVESGEHRDCVNASLGLRGTWNGLLVRESLVRACLVVETHVLGGDASKMFLAEDEDVIEQLSAERAGQALSEGIHVRRTRCGAHDAHARRSEYASEASTELRVGSQTSTSGAPSVVAFRAFSRAISRCRRDGSRRRSRSSDR